MALSKNSAPALSVLQVIPALDAGGAERTAVDVARAVIDAGGVSWIATAGGRLSHEAERHGVKLFAGDFETKNPLKLRANAAILADLIRRENINIVHARSRAPAWSALWAARRTRASFVTTYHGIYNAKFALKRYYNSIMARGDAVIANSHFTAAHIHREHQIDPSKITVIPRGIDIEAFTPANVTAERVEAVRKAWSLVPGRKVIMLPNRLTRWKGQLVFIEALSRLQNVDFEAVLVGDAQERDGYVAELRAALDQHRLLQRVRIPGHCADMPAAFSVADVVVAPSIEPEAFGRIAVEAQAMGRPLVASRLGAQTETIEDQVSGFLVEPGNAAELAAKIGLALSLTDDVRAALAKASRARVLASYTVEAMRQATLDVYRKLIATR